MWKQSNKVRTSRHRPKSAPYLRLKNSKMTSIWQSIGELGTLLWKKIFRKKSLTKPKKLKGWTLWGFSTSILSQNIEKLKGGPFGKKIFPEKKVLQCRKNWRGIQLLFSIGKLRASVECNCANARCLHASNPHYNVGWKEGWYSGQSAI